jgi:hypothetical protein
MRAPAVADVWARDTEPTVLYDVVETDQAQFPGNPCSSRTLQAVRCDHCKDRSIKRPLFCFNSVSSLRILIGNCESECKKKLIRYVEKSEGADIRRRLYSVTKSKHTLTTL